MPWSDRLAKDPPPHASRVSSEQVVFAGRPDLGRQGLATREAGIQIVPVPQIWATGQSRLGNTLWVLGKRLAAGGACAQGSGDRRPTGAHCLPRDTFPGRWATAQRGLPMRLVIWAERQVGLEGQMAAGRSGACLPSALSVWPRDDSTEMRMWIVHDLGLTLQIQVQRDGFQGAREKIDRLLQAEGLRDDPVAEASLRTLAVVCHVATDQKTEAGRDFASLVALIGRQPDDFRLVWNWTPTRKLLADSKTPASQLIAKLWRD